MSSPRVLIVEDDADTRFIYERFLDHNGFRVLACGTGEEGVELVRTERPDIVLMDVSIPGMDGWEATALLKEDSDTAEIPVVIVTAHAFPEDRARAERLGCAGFLTKPCDPARILEELWRCTGGPAG